MASPSEFEHRPYCLVLRRAYPHRDDEQGADENRAQNNGRHSQTEGDAITRERGVRGRLRKLRAHSFFSWVGLSIKAVTRPSNAGSAQRDSA